MDNIKIQRRKRSRAYLISSDNFIKLYNTSSSYMEMLRKLGYKDTSGSTIKILKERIAIEKLKPIDGRFGRVPSSKKSLDEVLVVNSKYWRSNLKHQLVQKNLIGTTCSICGAKPLWNNKPLVMILDHINGVNNDNRLENLRLVCPNCNSQLPTFGSRNRIYQKNKSP